MFRVKVGDSEYKISFRYSKHLTVTTCEIHNPNAIPSLVTRVTIHRWSGDKCNKRVARENALSQALRRFTPDKRKRRAAWAEYFKMTREYERLGALLSTDKSQGETHGSQPPTPRTM